MRIGIDARFLTHPQYGGFKSYTITALSALAETDAENHYIVYTDRPAESSVRLPANFKMRPVQTKNGILREQVSMPFAMKRDHLDLIHFPCNTAPLFSGTKMVVTIHDAIPLGKAHHPRNLKNRLLNSYWRMMLPKSARRANLVITDSQYARDDLCAKLDLNADKVRVIHLALNPIFNSIMRCIPPAGMDVRTPFILAFASPDGRKNHPAAIEAYHAADLGTSKPKLALVCSHPSVRSCLKSDDGIVPLGPVAVEELVWLYRNAQALIFPTLDEGFGLPPLEAMASGTPVVASNAGSLPEILGDCAVYANPMNVDGLAKGIQMVLQDGSLRDSLIRRGREHAARFSRERMGMELTAVYREAAGFGGLP